MKQDNVSEVASEDPKSPKLREPRYDLCLTGVRSEGRQPKRDEGREAVVNIQAGL